MLITKHPQRADDETDPEDETISRPLELYEFKWHGPTFHRGYPYTRLAENLMWKLLNFL